MVGSIDPRCETVRGIHWPNKGRGIVWSSRRGNHLGQRYKPTASTGRTYGCKRSDQTLKNSCGTGAVHIWVPAFAGTTKLKPPSAITMGLEIAGTVQLRASDQSERRHDKIAEQPKLASSPRSHGRRGFATYVP